MSKNLTETIRIKNIMGSVVTVPGLGTLRPGQQVTAKVLSDDVLQAFEQGMVVAPHGAPDRLFDVDVPPVIFQHLYPAAVLSESENPKLFKVIKAKGIFNLEDFAYLGFWFDGEKLICSLSEDGLLWGAKNEVEGLAAVDGPFALVELGSEFRVYYRSAGRLRMATSFAVPWRFEKDSEIYLNYSESSWETQFDPSFVHTGGGGPPEQFRMYFVGTFKGEKVIGFAVSPDGKSWHIQNPPLLTVAQEASSLSSIHLEKMDDGRWWMLFSDGDGINYAFSFDGIHWRTSSLNPIFQAGTGPFKDGCFSPSVAPKNGGGFFVYRLGRENEQNGVFVSSLRSKSLSVPDLLTWDRLGQGLSAKSATQIGSGTTEERDESNPSPALGDEWYDTQASRWEKWSGSEWKRT